VPKLGILCPLMGGPFYQKAMPTLLQPGLMRSGADVYKIKSAQNNLRASSGKSEDKVETVQKNFSQRTLAENFSGAVSGGHRTKDGRAIGSIALVA